MDVAAFFNLRPNPGPEDVLGSAFPASSSGERWETFGPAAFLVLNSERFPERTGICRGDEAMVAWCGVLRNVSNLRRRYDLPSSVGKLLLHLLTCHDETVLREVRGRICLFHYDGRRRRLLVVRDKMGLTPVSIYRGEGGFAAATDPEILRRYLSFDERPNRERLAAYLTQAPVCGRGDFIDPLERILPGEFAIVSPDGHVDLATYYSRRDSKRTWQGFATEARRLRRDVKKLLEIYADEPVVHFMSGGLDSTALVASHHLSQKNHCSQENPIFATSMIASAERVRDESDLIQPMLDSFGLEFRNFDLSNGISLTEPEFLRETAALGPQWHPGSVYERELTEFAMGSFGVPRMMLGVGGDHLFAGSLSEVARNCLQGGSYREIWRLFQRRWSSVYAARLLDRWAAGQVVPRKIANWLKRMEGTARPWLNASRWVRSAPHTARSLPLSTGNQIGQPYEATYAWEDLIREARRKEKLTGARYLFPYFYSPFVGKYSGAPDTYRYRNGQSKAILRQGFKEHLPDEILQAPKRAWLGQVVAGEFLDKKKCFYDLLNSSRLAQLALIDAAEFKAALGRFCRSIGRSDSNPGIMPIWQTLSAELWVRNVFG